MFVGTNEMGEIEAHSHWSCEYYLTHELNNDFYNIPCEFEASFNGAPPSFYHPLDELKRGGLQSCDSRLCEIQRSANLFVDIKALGKLL